MKILLIALIIIQFMILGLYITLLIEMYKSYKVRKRNKEIAKQIAQQYAEAKGLKINDN